MSLVKLGRARLSLVLPYHREQLRAARNPTLYDLFESYALAAQTLDRLLTEHRRREELINEYQALCLDMQAEVIALLKQIELAHLNPEPEVLKDSQPASRGAYSAHRRTVKQPLATGRS